MGLRSLPKAPFIRLLLSSVLLVSCTQIPTTPPMPIGAPAPIVSPGGLGGSGGAVAGPPAILYGRNLVWDEEFTYTGPPDPSKWAFEVGGGGWGNGELETYTNGSNAQVSNSVLTITAALNGNTYTSTRMHTRQSWTYGRFDIMAKLPCGQGTWPGIWMMPQNSVYGGWPASGEIDIMELSNKSPNSTKVLGTEHTMQSGGSGTNKSITVTTDCSAFHLYSLNWVPNEMQILVDGTVYNTYPADFGTIDFANNQQWPFLQAFYLILNIAVGGTLGGTPDPSAFPQTMQIEYIRVYQ